VQELTGDAVVAPHPADAQKPLTQVFAAANRNSQTNFSQTRETKNRAYEFIARRPLQAG
jgi:hypothetical protein